MKGNKKESVFTSKRIWQALIFLSATLITIYFYPGQNQFRYYFQEGKPWKYGLLTAPFDFPIYKDQAQIDREQDSILQYFQPYFTLDPAVGEEAARHFKTTYQESLHKNMDRKLYNKVLQSLQAVYHQGILPLKAFESMQQAHIQSIMVLDKNVAQKHLLSQLYSPRQAYETILENAASDSEKHILQQADLHNYIETNLKYDSVVSGKIREELLQRVSLSKGIVQAGERIIDRGEIVSPQTYQILNSLKTVSLKKTQLQERRESGLAGQIIVIVSLFGFMYLFLILFRPVFFNNLRQLAFLIMMITVITIATFFFSEMRVLGVYLIPFAILPIIVRTFMDSRIALFAHLITVLMCSFVAPFPLEFIYLQVTIGMATIYSLRDLTKRSQLVRCAILVFITYCVNYVGYALLTEDNWTKINLTMFLYFAINCTSLLFAYLLIYLLEKTFGFTSNVTLVELSDINSPILRQLSEVCPGTFQHSLQVSNLAAEAAIKIGANAQLVRTGALYHDIGKLSNPAFFTENQSGVNPHEKLSYEQSANIIIQHVNEGLKMADKLMLPQSIKDFIGTHHGLGKTKYFYNSFKNEFPECPINEGAFTYPGPNPTTKETAILMMADSVEAASRSLKDYTEENITRLVENIIDTQVSEGMFKETPLSFRDVEAIKAVFIEKLKTMYHTRISYPELKGEGESRKK